MRPKTSNVMKVELIVLLGILALQVIGGQTSCVWGVTTGIFMQSADCHEDVHQLEKTIKMLEETEERCPGYHGARVPLVMNYIADGDYGAAMLRLNQFDDPTEAAVLWQHLGETYGRTGRLDEAITAYKKAHSLNPNGSKGTLRYPLTP